MLISDRYTDIAKLCIWKGIEILIAPIKGTGGKNSEESHR